MESISPRELRNLGKRILINERPVDRLTEEDGEELRKYICKHIGETPRAVFSQWHKREDELDKLLERLKSPKVDKDDIVYMRQMIYSILLFRLNVPYDEISKLFWTHLLEVPSDIFCSIRPPMIGNILLKMRGGKLRPGGILFDMMSDWNFSLEADFSYRLRKRLHKKTRKFFWLPKEKDQLDVQKPMLDNALDRLQKEKDQLKEEEEEELLKYMQELMEDPLEKLEHMFEKLQELMLENPEFDYSDILYSKRHREQVWKIVEGMVSQNYVDNIRLLTCDVSANYDIRELREAIYRLALRRKKLSAYEEKHGASWHSIFYPLDHKSISDTGPHMKFDLVTVLHQVASPALCGLPYRKASLFKDERKYDVVSLLSLGDEPTLVTGTREQIVLERDTFRGKYVLVCCISAPVIYTSRGFQSLLNLCSELSSERGDCEMVMVARVHILADTREVFDQVFSAFPTHCHAVPYEDWERRERIWKLLSSDNDRHQCVVYDTNGLFLESFCADGYSEFPYGAEAFPFNKEMVRKVHKKRLQLRKGSLKPLLRPYESSPDVAVYEFISGQKKRISEVMKNKHVGLYVCCDGNLIPFLQELFNRCKEKQEEFEILLLYLPLLSMFEPDLFKESIDGLLRKHKISGWWYLPFNNSVSLRLWDLTRKADSSLQGDIHTDEEREDKLIIVGPDGKILDMYGAQVIGRHGIDVFPFTRAAAVEKKKGELRDLKLGSSLLPGKLFRGNDPADEISVDTLLTSKKQIIIYMGMSYRYTDNGLVSQYEKLKERNDGFEVVFIDYPSSPPVGTFQEVNASKYSAMPWYIHPCDGDYTPLAHKLKELVLVYSLVGFGKDGRICSLKLLDESNTLKSNTLGRCLKHTLFTDLYHQLFRYNEYADI